jgi:glycosyltransferase involved in cell wall biosynthesis
MKKRLVVFFNSYTWGISGGDVCLLELTKRMHDLNLLIVTSKLGKALSQAHGLNADYLLTTKEAKFKGVIRIYIMRIIKSLFLPLKVGKSDILYASSDFLPDVIPAFVRKFRNRKVKWVQKIFHIIPADRPVTHYAQRFSFFLIRRLADTVIVDNSLLRDELAYRKFDPNKIQINYPGINLADYQGNSIPANESEAVFLGRFHQSKGIFDLVDIWRRVSAVMPQAKLCIIGGGNIQIREELKKKISQARLENNITLAGYLEKQEMIGTMKKSKVFIFPSHEEGFGIAIAEAMGCGLPVVAWDLPVYRDVFQENIIQVKENDAHSFAGEIIKLLEDSVSRRKVSEAGYEYIKRYSLDNAVNRELQILGN